MTQAKIKPAQSKVPFDIKATKQVDKEASKQGQEKNQGFELSGKSGAKSKESRNDQ